MDEELTLPLDPSSDVPPYRQIVDRVWHAVAAGDLEAGARLPTVRQLAIDLGVHLDTVARAYRELELLGAVVQRPGQGTFVGLKPPDRAEFERWGRLERVCRDAIEQSRALGFSVDELIETLAEFRGAEPGAESQRRSR